MPKEKEKANLHLETCCSWLLSSGSRGASGSAERRHRASVLIIIPKPSFSESWAEGRQQDWPGGRGRGRWMGTPATVLTCPALSRTLQVSALKVPHPGHTRQVSHPNPTKQMWLGHNPTVSSGRCFILQYEGWRGWLLGTAHVKGTCHPAASTCAEVQRGRLTCPGSQS